MKLIGGRQIGSVEDLVRAKLAIVVPILKAVNAALSEDQGLQAQLPLEGPPDPVSVTPTPRQT